MTIRKIREILEVKSHPLEQHFDIPSGTTEYTRTERQTILTKGEDYDEKDVELETGYQEVADAALDLVNSLREHMQTAEPRSLARLAEVAGQQLNTALSAVEKKAKLKQHKENYKLRKTKLDSPKNINNTLIIDRNTLLEMLDSNPNLANDIVDVPFKQIENKE